MSNDVSNKTIAVPVVEQSRVKLTGWIVGLNGNHVDEDFKIKEGKNLIGTAADCDIVVTDPYLSAKHCVIIFDGDYTLKDLGSTNGTFVNGKKVQQEYIVDNDTVRLGRTEFKFKALY